jgi:hypothetical protein
LLSLPLFGVSSRFSLCLLIGFNSALCTQLPRKPSGHSMGTTQPQPALAASLGEELL